MVEHHPQLQRATVDRDPIALHADRAERRVALHRIEPLAAIRPQLDLRIDRSRGGGAPEQLVARIVDTRIGERDPAVHFAMVDGIAVVNEQLRAGEQLYGQAKPFAFEPFDPGVDGDLPPRQVRRPPQLPDARFWHHFNPDRLPDAAAARVPDRVRLELPILLAARLRQIGGVILALHDDLFVAAAQLIGDVRGEWRVPALVAHDARAIHPDDGGMIDGAEVQEHAVASRPLRSGERPAVPARAKEPFFAHAARIGQRSQRGARFVHMVAPRSSIGSWRAAEAPSLRISTSSWSVANARSTLLRALYSCHLL